MPYNLSLPSGEVIRDIPDDVPKNKAYEMLGAKMPEAFDERRNPDRQGIRALMPSKETAPFNLLDTNLSTAQGLVGVSKGTTDFFGANNAASQKLSEANKFLESKVSPERQAEKIRRQLIIDQANKKGGTMDQVYAYLGGVTEAPVQSIAEAIGSVVPFVGTSALQYARGVAKLAPATVKAVNGILGAVMGGGSVKGSIYDATYEELRKQGIGEEQAKSQAGKAQETFGSNFLSIAGGTALGKLGASSGIENMLLRGGSKKAATRIGNVAKSIAEEAPVEFLQGSQEQLATNLALQDVGAKVPTMQGVIGAGARDALTSGLLAGGLGAMSKTQTKSDQFKDRRAEIEAEFAGQTFDSKSRVGANDADLAAPSPAAPALPFDESDPLLNPLGNFNQDEIGADVAGSLNLSRKKQKKHELVSFSVEDLVDSGAPQDQVDGFIAKKLESLGYGSFEASPQDIFESAQQRGIDIADSGFADFMRRSTGQIDVEQMSPIQRSAALLAVTQVPEGVTSIPTGTNAQRFTTPDYDHAINTINAATSTMPTMDIGNITNIITSKTKVKDVRDARSLIQTAVKRGDLATITVPVFDVKDESGTTIRRYSDESLANAAAQSLNGQVQPTTSIKILQPGTINTLPGSPEIKRGTFKQGETPQIFEIKAGDTVLSTFKTQQEAEERASKFEEIRLNKAKAKQQEIETVKQKILNSNVKLDEMEAEGLANTPAYRRTQTGIATNNKKLQSTIERLNTEQSNLGQPLTIATRYDKPSNPTGYTHFQDGVPVATFPTQQQAEQSILGSYEPDQLQSFLTNVRKQENPVSKRLARMATGIVAEKTSPEAVFTKKKSELEGVLIPQMQKFGLGDLGLNILKGIDSGEGSGDGQYANRVLSIAVDAPNPLGVLRHEVVHALKNLGAFKTHEWRTLENKARDEWVNKFLKERKSENGDSLYDAYKNVYLKDTGTLDGFEDYINEEAIAEAFKFFTQTKPPVGMIGNIHYRLKKMFEALKNVFQGGGFRTAEGVFKRVEEGKAKPAGTAAPATSSPRYNLNMEDSGNKEPMKPDEIKIYDEELQAIIKKVGSRIAGMQSNKTLEDVRKAIEKLQSYTDQGIKGALWYENSANAVLKQFKGDKVLAEKFFQLIAITSANSEVSGNFTKTVNAWDQFVHNKPIKVGPAPMNKKVEDLLYFGIDWDGRKTNTFYLNLMEAMEGKDTGRSTIDLHMARMLFDRDVPTDAQYQLAENMVRLLATKMDMPARQVQAASWVTQKAKGIFDNYRKRGIKKNLDDNELRMYAFERAIGDYAHNFKTRKLTLPITPELREPSVEKQARTENVTGEVIPSVKSEMSQVSELKYANKEKLTNAIIKNEFVQKIAKSLGINSKVRVSIGTGGYEKTTTPNLIVQLINSNSTEAKKDARDLSDAMSYVFKQDATPFFRADPKLIGKGQVGYKIVMSKSNLTKTDEKNLFKAMRSVFGEDVGYTKMRGNELILINYRDSATGDPFLMSDADFEEAAKTFTDQANEMIGVDEEKTVKFGAESEYRYNDWEDNDTSKNIITSIQDSKPERSDISERLGVIRKSFTDTAREAVRESGQEPRFSIREGKLSESQQRLANSTVNVYGKERPTTTSLGTLISSTEDGVRNFWDWFGNSKQVDKDGKPLIKYHGTAREIEEFIPKQADSIFVTENPEFAQDFGSMSEGWMQDHYDQILSKEDIEKARVQALKDMDSFTKKELKLNKDSPVYLLDETDYFKMAVADLLPSRTNIMPLFVRSEKPFEFDNKNSVDEVVERIMHNLGIDKDSTKMITLQSDRMRLPSFTPERLTKEISKGYWPVIENPSVQKAIRELGYDSFFVIENGEKNLAVINPNQLKSAIGNVGAFSKEDNRIRYNLRSAPDTPEFKQWFGGSKVVDKNNNPLRMYTGTSKDKDFTKFKIPKNGAWFASDPESASLYAMENDSKGFKWESDRFVEINTASRVLPVYLQIKNPYVITDEDNKRINKDNYKRLQGQFFDELRVKGYDGVSFGDGVWVVIQKPTQIKSAIGNIGTYDPNKPDIRYNLRDEVSKMANGQVLNAVERTTTARDEKTFIGKIINAMSPQTFDKLRDSMVFKYSRIESNSNAVAALKGDQWLLADVSAIAHVLQSQRSAGIAAEAYQNGVPVYKNGYTRVDNLNGKVKGLIPIFAPLMEKYNDPLIYQMFQFYGATRRGARLIREGREELLTPADIRFGKMLEQKFPEFKQVFEDYQDFNKGLVKYLIDTEVITPEMGKSWMMYSDYLPFYRQLNEDKLISPSAFMQLSGIKPSKKLKGGEGELGEFMETIVQNTKSAIEAGMRNAGAKLTIRDAVFLKQAERLPPNSKLGEDCVTIREKGREVMYRLADPLLITAMKNLRNTNLPFLNALGFPAKVLQNLVVKDPSFIAPNLIRDSVSAWATSGVDMIPIVDTVKQYVKILTNLSPEAKRLKAYGIGMGYEFGGDRKASAKQFYKEIRAATGNRTLFEKATLPVTAVWDILDKISSASDLATRTEIYVQTLKRTGNEAEAFSQALEVMNFDRKGSNPAVQYLCAMTPFLNPRIQSMDVLYRAGFGKMASANKKSQHTAFWIRSASLVAMSCMYWWLMHDDDDYKNATQEERDNNWFIMGYKIPIPFELGVIFKVIPERILEYYWGLDTSKDVRDAVMRNLVSTFKLSPVPQAIAPAVENSLDLNFFTWKPILPRGQEDVAPAFQTKTNTTLLAQKLGKELNYPPVKIDNLIRGYFGAMGMYAADVVDAVIRTERDPAPVAKNIEKYPVLRRFIVDRNSTGNIEALYDLKGQVDQIVKTTNELQKYGKMDDLTDYLKGKENLPKTQKVLDNIQKDVNDLNKMKRFIVQAPIEHMTPEQKRDQINAITQSEIFLTRKMRELRKNLDQ
jgi:hypothetical protein